MGSRRDGVVHWMNDMNNLTHRDHRSLEPMRRATVAALRCLLGSFNLVKYVDMVNQKFDWDQYVKTSVLWLGDGQCRRQDHLPAANRKKKRTTSGAWVSASQAWLMPTRSGQTAPRRLHAVHGDGAAQPSRTSYDEC